MSKLTKNEQLLICGVLIIIVFGIFGSFLRKSKETELEYLLNNNNKYLSTNIFNLKNKMERFFFLIHFDSTNQNFTNDSTKINADSFYSQTNITQVDFQGNNNLYFPININIASREDLELLPGIGPVLAQRIVNFRDSTGLFIKKEDIILVKGIGIKKFSVLESLIIVNK